MKTTSNFGLKKPDGNDVVNIEDLNYNTDIVDKKLKEIESKASNIEVPVKSVNGKTGAVALNANDIRTSGSGSIQQVLDYSMSQLEHMEKNIEEIDLSAEKVNLDSTKLKSKTVKEGMEELFTFADNYKKSLANVVGSPVLATDTAKQVKSKIQGLKNTFASNLTSKQQPSNSNESLNNLINKVANISIGKKFATATRTIEPTESQTLIEIRGLSFTPSKVIVFADLNSAWGKLLETLILSNDYNSSIYEVCTVSCTTGTITDAAHYTKNYIVDKGFDVDMQHLFYGARYGGELRYWAFE